MSADDDLYTCATRWGRALVMDGCISEESDGESEAWDSADAIMIVRGYEYPGERETFRELIASYVLKGISEARSAGRDG